LKLKLDYSFIATISAFASIVNIISLRFWGRLADKTSFTFVGQISILSIGLLHIVWTFATKQNAIILVPVLNLTGAALWPGINMAMFNIPFLYMPEDNRTAYLGFNTAISGIIGFFTAFAAASFVGVSQSLSLNILGFSLSNMQILFFISGILCICVSFYVKIFMKK
jgi:hypothetical protein